MLRERDVVPARVVCVRDLDLASLAVLQDNIGRRRLLAHGGAEGLEVAEALLLALPGVHDAVEFGVAVDLGEGVVVDVLRVQPLVPVCSGGELHARACALVFVSAVHLTYISTTSM